MTNKEAHIPTGGPPSSRPSQEIHAIMGTQNIYQMSHDFYKELSASKIGHMFPKDPKKLLQASQKTGAFLAEICGGPPLYTTEHGPPQMRRRHLPFRIDKATQEEWLSCFLKILEQAPERYQFPREHLEGFKRYITEFSLWMVNTG